SRLYLNTAQDARYFPADESIGFITGLDIGRLYLARINHVLSHAEGEMSPPLLIGNVNEALQVEPVRLCREFSFFNEGDATTRLNWEPVDGDDISYYKIYRTTDSMEAFSRYGAFISSDSADIPYHPAVCRDYYGFTYCLYQMQAYDSVESTATEYYDRDPVAGAYYWVSAVLLPGFESEFSGLVRAELIQPPEHDIVVILGSTGTQSDFVYVDSIAAFYDSILSGYDYELYSWTDTNLVPLYCSTGYCTNWEDLAAFNLVMVEEYPAPKILSSDTEPQYKLLTRLIDAGRHLAYFGIPPGDNQITLNSALSTVTYDPSSFEARYFNLDSSMLRTFNGSYTTYGTPDSLAGFNHAVPNLSGPPELTFDTTRNCLKQLMNSLFDTRYCLPFTPALAPSDRAEVIYSYGSLYPETSEFDGLPCGLLCRHDESRTCLFSFHLWAMKHADARALVDYLMTDPPQPSPSPLPGSFHLSQNYPNPFNQGTTISFYLDKSSHVELEVFNILGQKVRSLVDGYRNAGPHSEVWDGRDGGGQAVASGIYLYRLKTGTEQGTKKMVLVR
ncbi:MAG: T9SS type A sorting domain-containing protein, partial [candidate division Zixibacteria bacterium]|nr:T9SS type A sorting domain-containing protein [candidate division Zixibacteria bacterium]